MAPVRRAWLPSLRLIRSKAGRSQMIDTPIGSEKVMLSYYANSPLSMSELTCNGFHTKLIPF
jgi:hypothetical protein